MRSIEDVGASLQQNFCRAARAADTIAELGITNVRVITADGGDGYAAGGPYDRIAFTAGTSDLPRQFYEQIKAGGLLLAVIKNEGDGDNLFLLQKMDDQSGFVRFSG